MDWKNIIQELLEMGLTQNQIALGVSVSQPTISALASGTQKNVNYTLGQNLVAFHKRQSKAYSRRLKSGTGQMAQAG